MPSPVPATPRPPPLSYCPFAWMPWVCLGCWPGAPGPPGGWENLLTTPTLPAPWAHRGGHGRSPGPHPLWYPRRLQPLGTGVGGSRDPHPLCEMEPPATACHVAQHVTALLCCLEQSQAEAELAPDGAGLGLGLDALSQESGPERASHWSKATQPIRDPPGEVLVSEGDVAGSPGASPWPGTSPAGATPELAVNSGTSWRAPTEA